MGRPALAALSAPGVLAVALMALAPAAPAGATSAPRSATATARHSASGGPSGSSGSSGSSTVGQGTTGAVSGSTGANNSGRKFTHHHANLPYTFTPSYAHRSAPGGPIGVVDAHPSAAQLSEGKTLFDESCSSCHGLQAQGSSLAPNLRGLGPGIPYLWVSNGWMPLANPTSQPIPKPAQFNHSQTVAIAEYVGSLGRGGLPIYSVDLSHASERVGLDVFALNCAPCHTITGVGDALSDGVFAPSLHAVSATQVAEAIRSGPGNMPVFSSAQITNSQLADLASYVTKEIGHPTNPGGLGLGGVGPVAEGFVALFIGVGASVVAALWIGERAEDESGGGPGRREPSEGDGSGPGGPEGTEVIHA